MDATPSDVVGALRGRGCHVGLGPGPELGDEALGVRHPEDSVGPSRHFRAVRQGRDPLTRA